MVPDAHCSRLSELGDGALAEMMTLAARCENALRRAYRPSGINLGINLGRSAGAGIEGHVHLHLVPRWDGDTNFMTVVHDTRVIPEALGVSWRRLRQFMKDLPGRGTRQAARAAARRRGPRRAR